MPDRRRDGVPLRADLLPQHRSADQRAALPESNPDPDGQHDHHPDHHTNPNDDPHSDPNDDPDDFG